MGLWLTFLLQIFFKRSYCQEVINTIIVRRFYLLQAWIRFKRIISIVQTAMCHTSWEFISILLGYIGKGTGTVCLCRLISSSITSHFVKVASSNQTKSQVHFIYQTHLSILLEIFRFFMEIYWKLHCWI